MNEVTKIAAEEATKTANGLLAKVFGPGAETMGINMAQGIRLRAVQNQIRGLKKLAEICEKEKFSMRQVNIKAVFPYLEGIALEEEPVVEDLWANLMANYLDTAKNLEQTVYPSILKQLSTADVHRLKTFSEHRFITVVPREIIGQIGEPVYTYEAISNLERLGLIKVNIKVGIMRSQLENSIINRLGMQHYLMTEFGKGFYEACQR